MAWKWRGSPIKNDCWVNDERLFPQAKEEDDEPAANDAYGDLDAAADDPCLAEDWEQ